MPNGPTPTPWYIQGNAGTSPNNNFVGTSDPEPLVIKAANIEGLRVDVTGKVGVGTTGPTNTLSVGNTASFDPAANVNSAVMVGPAAGNDYGGGVLMKDLSYYAGMWTTANGAALNFAAGGTSAGFSGSANGTLVVYSGNVGIGNAAPAYPLHLAAEKMLRIEGGINPADGANYFSFGGNGALGIDAPGIPNGRFVVLNNGNVGIGNANPATSLHLQGASDQQSTLAISRSDNGKFVRLGVGTGGVALAFDPTSYLVVQNNDAMGIGGILNGPELLRVTADGSVGIGTGAPASKLHVAGNVSVDGDILVTGADCAEHFDVVGASPLEPGAVVVIDESGALRESGEAYDTKVAGVVSGGVEYRHGLVLDNRPSQAGRIPVALVGKVYCKVDADYGPIRIGDLLTTSATPGHAMKAANRSKAFGAILGKALGSLEAGRKLIPILVALQ
jgi:hypothetical protein